MTHWRQAACTLASVVIIFFTALAPAEAQDESTLTNTTQDSGGDLIWPQLGKNPVDRALDAQPVIPFRLTDEWYLPRTIAPLIYQVEGTLGARDVPGLRDMKLSLLPPSKPGTADEPAELEPDDPWEAFNGKMFEFNRRMDTHALKPVAKQWKTVVPEPAQVMIANAFHNATVVPRVVNNLLQGKWEGAGREVSRFLINSTAGVAGLFDPARDVWHIAKSPADFGQTLGKWGAEPGPYLVLPFAEPLTVRDGIGKLVDRVIDPLTYVLPVIPALGLTVGNRVNERALNYELFVDFDEGVIDPYTAVRDGYLQRRKRMLDE